MKKTALDEKLAKLERQNAAAAMQLLAIDSPVEDVTALAEKNDSNGLGQALRDYEFRIEKTYGAEPPAKYQISRHFNEVGAAAKDYTSMIIKDKEEKFTHFAVSNKYYDNAPENVLAKLKHPQMAASVMKSHTVKGFAPPDVLASGKAAYPTLMDNSIIKVVPPTRNMKDLIALGEKPDPYYAVLTDKETGMDLASAKILETQATEGTGMLYTLKKPLLPTQRTIEALAAKKAENARIAAERARAQAEAEDYGF